MPSPTISALRAFLASEVSLKGGVNKILQDQEGS